MRYLILLIASLLHLPAYTQLATPHNVSTTTHALVIGISDYQDQSLPLLENADKSALAFAAYLKSKAGGSLNDKNIRLLINETATAGKMVASLDWIMEAGKKGDRVIVYFTGYGNLLNLMPYNIPQSAMNASVFPCQKLKTIITKIALEKQLDLIIIADIHPPFISLQSDLLKEKLMHRFDSLKVKNEFLFQANIISRNTSSGFQEKNQKSLTYHLLNAMIGEADYNEDKSVNILEAKSYLHSNANTSSTNEVLLYVFSQTEYQAFSSVDESLLKQLEKNKNHQLPPIVQIDSEDFENSLLITQSENIRDLYQDFVVAIRLGNLLVPQNLSASNIYEQLLVKSKSTSLNNAAKRKLAAALQDESQQAINAYLKTDPSELNLRWQYSDRYQYFPLYLKKAASLLGEKHYLYKQVSAKQHYFEGIAIRLDAEKTNDSTKYQTALQQQTQALELEDQGAFIYNEMGLIYYKLGSYEDAISNFLKAISFSPTWSIPYSNLCLVHSKLEQWDTAKSYCQKAIDIKADYSSAHTNMGGIYLALNDFKAAEIYFKQMIKLFPELPYPYYNMACSKALQGKTGAANRWLQKALNKGFVDYKHIQTDRDLDSIRSSRKYQKLMQRDSP